MKTSNAPRPTPNARPRKRAIGCWAVIATWCVFGAASLHAEHASLSQAQRALSEGIPQIAVHTLRSALATPGFPAPERAAARRLLAEAQLEMGDSAAALETLSAFADASDSAATLLRGHAYAAAERWSEALPIYQSLHNQPGVPSSAAIGEAECLQALGRTREAIEVLGNLVESGHAGTAARLRFASLLVEADRTNEARSVLQATPPGTPGDENWRRYLEARVLLLEKNPRGALAILEPMLRAPAGSRPTGLSANLFAAATLALAEANLAPENPEAAIKILESFIHTNPESPQLEIVFRRLDQLYALDKTPQERVMHGFVRHLPDSRVAVLATYYLTQMQIRGGRYDRAAGSIAYFMGKYPKDPMIPDMQVLRARVALLAGNPPTEQALRTAETELDDASLATDRTELKAEIALRTALVNLYQREFVRAVNHLKTAKESPRLRSTAMFDSALAWLMQQNHAQFEKELAEFSAEGATPLLAGHLRLEQGLVKARAEEADAESVLKTFLRDYPSHPRRLEAQLALAEHAFLNGRHAEAIVHVQAVNQAAPSPDVAAQAEYLAIFLEDAKEPRNDERVIALARGFIERRPKSPLVSQVRMKLGQVYFQREDYLNAQEQFETLATNDPDGEYAEVALYLAGQCGTKLFTPEAHKHALELFGQVAERKGEMEQHARLQQAILKSQLGAEDDAVKIYDIVLAANAPAEVRYAALIGKGDNLAALARKDPKHAAPAIATYDLLLANPDAGPRWRNEAAYKKAKVLEQMGRKDDALLAFNEILDRNSGPGPRETTWLARAGFEAASLLEAQRQWKGAVAIYRKMTKIPGPHVEQARQRVKALQGEHFLWD
jgi:tetratricopeptide (TPR) repeat protein